MTTLITEGAQPVQRWDSSGNQWHRHEVVHVHADTGTDHAHILATDEFTLARLRRLLDHAARGPLTKEYQREAGELAKLLT